MNLKILKLGMKVKVVRVSYTVRTVILLAPYDHKNKTILLTVRGGEYSTTKGGKF